MTTPHRLRLLRSLVKHPVVIGATLAYSATFAWATVPAVGDFQHHEHLYMLVGIICWTPFALYVDYTRAIPGTSATLLMWIATAAGFSIWGIATWLHLEKTVIAMDLNNRWWFGGVAWASAALSIWLSKPAYVWFSGWLAARRSGDARTD